MEASASARWWRRPPDGKACFALLIAQSVTAVLQLTVGRSASEALFGPVELLMVPHAAVATLDVAFCALLLLLLRRGQRSAGRAASICLSAALGASFLLLVAATVLVAAAGAASFRAFALSADGVVEPDWVPFHRFGVAYLVFAGARLAAAAAALLLVACSGSPRAKGTLEASETELVRLRRVPPEHLDDECDDECDGEWADEEGVPGAAAPGWDERGGWGGRPAGRGGPCGGAASEFGPAWMAVALFAMVWIVYAAVAAAVLQRTFLDAGCDDCNAQCNPLAASSGSGCLLPLPSSAFQGADGRVRIPGAALPLLRSGTGLRGPHGGALSFPEDGWQPLATMAFEMPGIGAGAGAGLRGPLVLDASASASSTTLILRASDGSAVPHYADVDALSKPHEVVVLQPAEPMVGAERYVVVVQGLRGADGAALPRTAAFDRVWRGALDGGGAALSQRYASDILPLLRRLPHLVASLEGVQLCWDFTVRSAAGAQSLEAAAGAAAARAGSVRARATRRAEAADCGADGYRAQIYLRMDLPSILQADRRDAPAAADAAASAARDGGLSDVGVLVAVPCALARGAVAGRVLFVGHGIFADRAEALDRRFGAVANGIGDAVVVALDWRGFSRHDLPVVLRALTWNPRLLVEVGDAARQGFLNVHSAVQWTRGAQFREIVEGSGAALAREPEYLFYGYSLGGILGSSLVTNVVGFERAVLGAGGAPFSFLLPMSDNFIVYKALLMLSLYDGRSLRVLLALLQGAFAMVSGISSAQTELPSVRDAKTPRILLYTGLGDSNVPSIGAETLARQLNCTVAPSAEALNPDLAGLRSAPPGATGRDGCTLLQLRYEEELQRVASTRGFAFMPATDVHLCMPVDGAVINETVRYLDGRPAADACAAAERACRRQSARESCGG